MSQRNQLIAWLQDAHAMEISLFEVLERHRREFLDFPELEKGYRFHRDQTQRQADALEECLQSLGGSVSVGKTVMADLMGRVQGVTTGFFKDAPVKSILMDYAAEHFEIACYKSIITAAEEISETVVAATCRRILEEEQAMVRWLDDQIYISTRDFLRHQPMID